MKLNKVSIAWFFTGRRKMKRQVKGFHAHWNTCVSGASSFDEYANVFEGSVINSSHIGRFSKVIGSNVCHAEIGAFVSIAQGCTIGGGGDHPLDQVSHHSLFYSPCNRQHPYINLTDRHKYPNDLKKTHVGNDVWIGANVIIKHGVSIGDGAVVATGAVVVNDVQPYAIVGGVPAKVIKHRHSEELRGMLAKSNWWNWPVAALQVISDEFNSNTPLTVERFKEITRKTATFLK